MGLVFPFSFLQPQGEAPPPSDNFSYNLCLNPEVTLVSTVQLHDDGALALWYNCQWYSIGETIEAPPTVPAPLPSQVFSSLAPCEEAQELFNYLRWRKCGSEDEFIYTLCCELPEGEVYTAGVTTTNNFILEEPSADCYTFEAPSELPEGVVEAGCPEFVVPLNCSEEPCSDDPGIVITPEMFVEPEDTGINMTVLVNAGDTLNTPYAGGELGAFYDLTGDGNLQCVALSEIPDPSALFQLAIWGDNGATPDKDGLDNGDIPYFAILHEEEVYLFEPSPAFSGYVDNGIVIITNGTSSPL